MRFNVLPLIIVFLLSGCIASYFDYPFEYKMFRLKDKFFQGNKQRLHERVKEDMLKCGFPNSSPSAYDLGSFNYVEATLCMEDKGYIKESLPKGVCHRYPESSACQARQSNNPK